MNGALDARSRRVIPTSLSMGPDQLFRIVAGFSIVGFIFFESGQ